MGELPLIVWLLLGGLAYAMVTAVLYGAGRHLHCQRRRHDLRVHIAQRRIEQERSRGKATAGG